MNIDDEGEQNLRAHRRAWKAAGKAITNSWKTDTDVINDLGMVMKPITVKWGNSE